MPRSDSCICIYKHVFVYTTPQECLKDKRQSLVDKANRLQCQFDAETEALSRKQAWYKANQDSITRESEANYTAFCNDSLFRIHILEQRLNM